MKVTISVESYLVAYSRAYYTINTRNFALLVTSSIQIEILIRFPIPCKALSEDISRLLIDRIGGSFVTLIGRSVTNN
jgi:hypothetical protein